MLTQFTGSNKCVWYQFFFSMHDQHGQKMYCQSHLLSRIIARIEWPGPRWFHSETSFERQQNWAAVVIIRLKMVKTIHVTVNIPINWVQTFIYTLKRLPCVKDPEHGSVIELVTCVRTSTIAKSINPSFLKRWEGTLKVFWCRGKVRSGAFYILAGLRTS